MLAETMTVALGAGLALAAAMGAGRRDEPARIRSSERGLRTPAHTGDEGSAFFSAAAISRGGTSQAGLASAAQGPIQLYIRDHLGVNEVREEVRVLIDAQEAGRLSVDSLHPMSVLPVTVAGAGRHSYTLEVSAFFRPEQGELKKVERTAKGDFMAAPGKTFKLAGIGTGDAWAVHLEEEPEEIEE